jgi:hypothetical protein
MSDAQLTELKMKLKSTEKSIHPLPDVIKENNYATEKLEESTRE